MTARRHSWGQPYRFMHKTERMCVNGCGIIKVTRHEAEGGHDVHWHEFWRNGEQLPSRPTPACEPARVTA